MSPMSTTLGDVAANFGEVLFADLAGTAAAAGLAYSYLDRSQSR